MSTAPPRYHPRPPSRRSLAVAASILLLAAFSVCSSSPCASAFSLGSTTSTTGKTRRLIVEDRFFRAANVGMTRSRLARGGGTAKTCGANGGGPAGRYVRRSGYVPSPSFPPSSTSTSALLAAPAAAASAASSAGRVGLSALLKALSPSSLRSDPTAALAALTSAAATSIPPVAYFWALMSAGVGMPVSEDALAVFAGTILPTLSGGGGGGGGGDGTGGSSILWAGGQRGRLILALYCGVVLSDLVTFTLGRALRSGVLEPVRRRMTLTSDDDVDEEVCDVPPPMIFDPSSFSDGEGSGLGEKVCHPPSPVTKSHRRKRDVVLAKIEKSGNYIGFVTRFSVGLRTPLMLLAGFSGKVPPAKFALGTMAGAACTLPLQLGAGYLMKDNLGPALGALGTIGVVAACGPAVLAAAGWAGGKVRRVGRKAD